MKIVRIVLLALILLGAIVVTVSALSTKPAPIVASGTSNNYSSMIAAAKSDYETNSANTDNVYQQQVVAAWGAKDLLEVIATQNTVIIDNEDALLRAQATQADNTADVLSLMKALIVVAALLIAAVAVVGVTMIDRKPAGSGAVPAPANPDVSAEPTVQ